MTFPHGKDVREQDRLSVMLLARGVEISNGVPLTAHSSFGFILVDYQTGFIRIFCH